MKNKFELRWLERDAGGQTVRVLQYRTYSPSTYFSNLYGSGPSEEFVEHYWGDWLDVPIVKEKK